MTESETYKNIRKLCGGDQEMGSGMVSRQEDVVLRPWITRGFAIEILDAGLVLYCDEITGPFSVFLGTLKTVRTSRLCGIRR